MICRQRGPDRRQGGPDQCHRDQAGRAGCQDAAGPDLPTPDLMKVYHNKNIASNAKLHKIIASNLYILPY